VQKRNDLFRFLLKEQNSTPFKIVVDGKENYFTKEVIDITQGQEKAGNVIVLKNITSFKELDVAKTNFIATVSHELKTPLASSDFSLKLLEDARIGELSNEQRELIQQLKNDNQRMLKILSELLNMSQVEAGKIQLNMQDARPDIIVQNSINAIAVSARERQITIQQNIEKSLPAVRVDSDKLSWVINNFLTNAIKFSPENGTIKVAVEQKDQLVIFSVADQGPGIAEPYLSKIFDRYFQVPGRADMKGSGIGLAICKEFIEAMGGQIWVKSEIGAGSEFGFNLPSTIS
jgi:signal transduction histidine kinase